MHARRNVHYFLLSCKETGLLQWRRSRCHHFVSTIFSFLLCRRPSAAATLCFQKRKTLRLTLDRGVDAWVCVCVCECTIRKQLVRLLLLAATLLDRFSHLSSLALSTSTPSRGLHSSRELAVLLRPKQHKQTGKQKSTHTGTNQSGTVSSVSPRHLGTGVIFVFSRSVARATTPSVSAHSCSTCLFRASCPVRVECLCPSPSRMRRILLVYPALRPPFALFLFALGLYNPSSLLALFPSYVQRTHRVVFFSCRIPGLRLCWFPSPHPPFSYRDCLPKQIFSTRSTKKKSEKRKQ